MAQNKKSENVVADLEIEFPESEVEFKIVSNAVFSSSYSDKHCLRVNIKDMIRKLKAFQDLSDCEEVVIKFNEVDFEHKCFYEEEPKEETKICKIEKELTENYKNLMLNSLSFMASVKDLSSSVKAIDLKELQKLKCVLTDKKNENE